MVDMVTKPHYSWGLEPGTKVCSENMIDWQYLLLGHLQQEEIVSPEFVLCLKCSHVLHVT